MKTRNLIAIYVGLAIGLNAAHAEPIRPLYANDANQTADSGYYPSKEVMAEIYKSLLSSGDLPDDAAIANPSEDILRKAYRFAEETGRLESHGYSLRGIVQNPTDLLIGKHPVTQLSAKALNAGCLDNAKICMGESALVALTCGAMMVPGGFWFALGGCAAELLIISGQHGIQECKNMRNLCPQTSNSYNPLATTVGTKGTTTGKKYTSTCGGINRVNGVYGKYKDHSPNTSGAQNVLTQLRLTCTNGTNLDFVTNNTTGVSPTTTWAGGPCNRGYLVQGIHGRSGSLIDGVGRVCDKVVDGTEKVDIDSPVIGQPTGGSPFNLKCEEHGYLYGINVWIDESLPLNRRFITGIEPLCKK